jgi:hypothetical protein
MLDEDMVNQINKEDWQYIQWERAEKNRILAMGNVERKTAEWRKFFPAPPELKANEIY